MKRFFLLPLVLVLAFFSSSAALDELKIGLIPEQNLFKQLDRHRPLGEYLSKKIGIPIKFTVLSRYGNIINSFENERLDGAFWGSFTGALAIDKLGILPLARPLSLDGTSTYFGIIFVAKDSPVKSAKEMKGKRIALVDRATTAGYLFPRAYLRESAGVTDFEGYFSQVFFAGSHDAAIKALVEGEADIACAKNTVYESMLKSDPSLTKKVQIIATSHTVPSNALGVRGDLDPTIVGKLKSALLEMGDTPEGLAILEKFGAKRFIPTASADYDPVFDLAKKAGIDPSKYNYENK